MDDDFLSAGNADDPRGDLLAGEDEHGISPLARIRPKQGALIALVLFGLLVLWGPQVP
ncbi:MAG: hypothetical protein Q7T55_14415 [Solirubrobacteraceae bacterium]|nr:hypothetical protein [Solirubrobacteraceae bacterium]